MSLRGRLHTVIPAAKILEFLMVACGQTHFAIQADTVRSVIRPEESDAEAILSTFGITTVPVHLSEQFGLTGSYLSPESRILVCGMHGTNFAFRVDRVMGLHDIDTGDIKPLLPHFVGSERRWIAGMFLYQQTVALVLHTAWLLSNDRGSRALSAPVLESACDGYPSKASVATLIDVSTEGLNSHSAHSMEFEEATDADDTPWAQI